jgi:Transcriptional regulator
MRSKSAELKTKICDTVNDWKRNVGRTPSLKELGDELGVNKSTIYRYLVEMNEDGLLEYDGSSIDTKELNRRTMNTARAAIVGSIPCGEAQPEESMLRNMLISRPIFSEKETFISSALKVILWKMPASLREISLSS